MIPFHEIKMGDYVLASYNNTLWEGQVAGLNNDEKEVCVATNVQEFWFEPRNLFPLPLNEDQLLKLNFDKTEYADTGEVKYSKGAFRLVIPSKDDFSSMEMWYREDRRHHPDVHYIHQLQNHFHQMTKVPLAK